MLWRRWGASFGLILTIGLGLYFLSPLTRLDPKPVQTLNMMEFSLWLDTDPKRAEQFAKLQGFLAKHGVAGIVPDWTLARGDQGRIGRCVDAGFIFPPETDWPKIVPALRLVRDKVIPAVGRVEVISVYRTNSLNACAGGALASRHLDFSALDLIALEQPDGRAVFDHLCKAWKQAGPQSRWGLGAYFDPRRPTANKAARFHVDATGWRSWGFSKKAETSGCKLIASEH
jgi:Peptidase M15